MIKANVLDAKITNQKVKNQNIFAGLSFLLFLTVEVFYICFKKTSLTEVLMKYIVWSELLWFGAT